MTQLTKQTNHIDIFIQENWNNILIRQNWKYQWLNQYGTTPWTYAEKKNFHDAADDLIWNMKDSHEIIKTRGSSSFAQKHASIGFNVQFDIMCVLSNEHWSVDVTKIPRGRFKTCSANWHSRTVNLDTEDFYPVNRNANGNTYTQYTVQHEFGHMIGNSIYASPNIHGDEYKSSISYSWDKLSLMNIGDELRVRHVDFLISELNFMIPNTTFYN